MKSPRPEAPRLILFGAFDRHNFGDLLLAHCAAARDNREPVFAGLVERDLHAHGGHHVHALNEVIALFGSEPAELVIVGGEILTTTAWEAAVMVQSPAAAALAIRLHDHNGMGRDAWAHRTLDNARALPYVLSPVDVPAAWTIELRAIGGVGFDSLPPSARQEALTALAVAHRVTVRDALTQSALLRNGIRTALERDPASEAAGLFGRQIEERLKQGEVAELRREFPRWIAVQIAAHWGDDRTLGRVARRVAAAAYRENCAIVIFRAGIAPWHDDRETQERLAEHLRSQAPDIPATLLESVHVLDICTLLATARRYVGTSLHGWIVADSFGVPGICLVQHPGEKAAAYLDTWHPQPRAWRTLHDETGAL